MSKQRTQEKAKAVRETLAKKGIKHILPDENGYLYKSPQIKKALNTNRKAVRRSFLGTRIFYNCPRCGRVLQFSKKLHKNLCMSCGQYLDWNGYADLCAVFLKVDNADEAFYWAGRYASINGTTYDLDVDQWRLIYREFPAILYFPFPEGKAYGRFMREAAKEATILESF